MPDTLSFRTTHSIGITMGDPAGIGPEICLKAWAELQNRPLVSRSGHPIALRLYGDLPHLTALAHQLALAIDPASVVHCAGLGPYPLGVVSAAAGKAAAEAIRQAARDCLDQRLSAMVTAPIHKEAFKQAGVNFPGHTEFLAHLSAQPQPPDVRMLLISDDLCVVLDSIHLPLREAIACLNTPHLLQTLRIAQTAGPLLHVPTPRIALAALNPHASDGGLFGDEEARILEPAVAQARAEGIQVTGPLPADTAFMKALGTQPAARSFDLVVCLYHDQGLIPMKLRGIDEGVNITLGLPFLRTSVDHGTAFDIAHAFRASPASLLAAIRRAAASLP
jgi:4-hydroxythreonine-4-phosphate dehydrogenase